MSRDYVLWTLRKGQHVTEGHVRLEPPGLTFVLCIDGHARWHERFEDGQGVALGELSERTRRHLEENGWE